MSSNLDRHRLALLLGMTGSDFAGERAAAAAKAAELVRAAGLTWGDVVSPASGSSGALARQSYEEGYHQGLEEGRRSATSGQARGQYWSQSSEYVDNMLGDRTEAVLDLCHAAVANGGDILSLKELDFLAQWPGKIASWGPRTFCSPAQWNWLAAIRDKLHRRGRM